MTECRSSSIQARVHPDRLVQPRDEPLPRFEPVKSRHSAIGALPTSARPDLTWEFRRPERLERFDFAKNDAACRWNLTARSFLVLHGVLQDVDTLRASRLRADRSPTGQRFGRVIGRAGSLERAGVAAVQMTQRVGVRLEAPREEESGDGVEAVQKPLTWSRICAPLLSPT